MKDLSRVIRVIKSFSPVLKNISKAMNPFDAEVLFLLLERSVERGTLYINRSDLGKKTREQTEDMLVALTKLFYEMVYKRSPAWQEMAREWAEGERGRKVDFDKSFKAFIEGREKTVILPPNKKTHNVFIYVEEGETISAFKAEHELVLVFLKEAEELIFNDFAKPLNFGVLTTTTEFLKALSIARGILYTGVSHPNGSIYCIGRLVL